MYEREDGFPVRPGSLVRDVFHLLATENRGFGLVIEIDATRPYNASGTTGQVRVLWSRDGTSDWFLIDGFVPHLYATEVY